MSTDPEWPHGVLCAQCNRDISERGEPKMHLPVERAGGAEVGVVVCAECWTSAETLPGDSTYD